jgi:glycosidase
MFYGGGAASGIDPAAADTFHNSRISLRAITPEQKHMQAYYRTLLAIRKTNSALSKPDKENTTVTNVGRCIQLIRNNGDDSVLCFLNFNTSAAVTNYRANAGKKSMYRKILDSSDKAWAGPGSMAKKNITGTDSVALNAASIVIYSNH